MIRKYGGDVLSADMSGKAKSTTEHTERAVQSVPKDEKDKLCWNVVQLSRSIINKEGPALYVE